MYFRCFTHFFQDREIEVGRIRDEMEFLKMQVCSGGMCLVTNNRQVFWSIQAKRMQRKTDIQHMYNMYLL